MSKTELQLVVDHLGPVEHAEIALRPLTIFVGRNNTGKTYVAQTLYACRQAVRRVVPRPAKELSGEERSALIALIQQSQTSQINGEIAKQVLPVQLHDYVTQAIRSGLENTGREVLRRLVATFGVDDVTRITSWGKGKSFRFEVNEVGVGSENVSLFGSGGTTAPVGKIVRGIEIDLTELDGLLLPSTLFGKDFGDEESDEFHDYLAWNLVRKHWQRSLLKARLGGDTHYLPAGRSGLLNAWTDVVKLRIQLAKDSYGLQEFEAPFLDGVALDFISSLADVLGHSPRYTYRFIGALGSKRQSRQDVFKPAIELLNVLMEGTISSEQERETVPTLAYKQDGHRIAIRHASSMVADLAPLAIWVERLLSPGDLLIVDEPESHLHPEAIRLIARVLIRLANCGVQVVCATHSSVLLNEISNCMLRHETSSLISDETTLAYTSVDFLSPDDLSVHHFLRDESTRMVTVKQVEVDPNWGIPEDEFVKVAEDLTEETAQLIGMLD